MAFAELDEHGDDSQEHLAAISEEALVGDLDLPAGVEDRGALGGRARCDSIDA